MCKLIAQDEAINKKWFFVRQYAIKKDILFLNLDCVSRQINLTLLDLKNNCDVNHKSINYYNAS